MGIKIWGRPEGGKAELIDESSRGNSPAFLMREYSMAYRGWKIWAGLKRDEPKDEPDASPRHGYFY